MVPTLAVAPSGAAAFLPGPANPPPGGRQDHHSGIIYWTPRRPVPLSAVTNSSLEETPEDSDWTPFPPNELKAALSPGKIVRIQESAGTTA